MLTNKEFDLWADGYDACVSCSEEAAEYPFAGYKHVLETIYNTVRQGSGKRILDIGFGTGILSKKLYDAGFDITGIDFSEKMIAIAQKKMPEAVFLLQDFSQGLPAALENKKFDFILCTYAIHHLDDTQKEKFLHELLAYLNSDGLILIGDVAFETCAEQEVCKSKSGGLWDDEDIYPVLEHLRPVFPNIRFQKITACSGVFTIDKENYCII